MKYTIVLTLVIIATAIHGRDGLDVKETVKGAATKLVDKDTVKSDVEFEIQRICAQNTDSSKTLAILLIALERACKRNKSFCPLANKGKLVKFTCLAYYLKNAPTADIEKFYGCAKEVNEKAIDVCLDNVLADLMKRADIKKILQTLRQ